MDVTAFNCSHNYGSASQLSKAILSKLTGNFANCSATYWTSTKSPTAGIYSVPSSALCRALQNQLTLYGLTPSRTWFSVVLPHLTSFSLTFSDIRSLIQNQCFQRFKNLIESSSFSNINFFFFPPRTLKSRRSAMGPATKSTLGQATRCWEGWVYPFIQYPFEQLPWHS